jgi:hypothetical protein
MAGPRESRSAVASSLDNLRRVRGLGGLDFVVVLMVALNVLVTGMKTTTQRRTEREKYVETACGEKKESVNNLETASVTEAYVYMNRESTLSFWCFWLNLARLRAIKRKSL